MGSQQRKLRRNRKVGGKPGQLLQKEWYQDGRCWEKTGEPRMEEERADSGLALARQFSRAPEMAADCQRGTSRVTMTRNKGQFCQRGRRGPGVPWAQWTLIQPPKSPPRTLSGMKSDSSLLRQPRLVGYIPLGPSDQTSFFLHQLTSLLFGNSVMMRAEWGER